MQSLQQTIGNIVAKKNSLKSNLVTMLCTKFFAICETFSVFPNPCNFDLVACEPWIIAQQIVKL
jgi:hypothetical protein